VDLAAEKSLQDFLIAQIEDGKIHAAHDISEGGLLVCIAEMLFDKEALGANIFLGELGQSGRLDALLFGESQARAVVAVRSEDVERITEAAQKSNLPVHKLGQINDSDQLNIEVAGDSVLSAKVSVLKDAWESAIPKHMDHS
jgi:phosphoribosylformylglycinamidine synthase